MPLRLIRKSVCIVPVVSPLEAAQAVSLRYVSDSQPGLRRKRIRDRFAYFDPEGQCVRDARTLERIQSLVIPPAWTDVWICRFHNGHLQATGRDSRGRKQYRYHPAWREVRDETKYGRMIQFGRMLPRLRRRVNRDLKLPGIPRNRVLATIVRLLETTLIRIGNEEYARINRSFGLTTLRNRHVLVRGATIVFRFRGKSGIEHAVGITDSRLASLVRRCQELPGHELFQYTDDDGQAHAVSSAEVNDYLREITGENFTAKDFRTWAGTVLAATTLCTMGQFDSQAESRRQIASAISEVARRLGNTPAVCRKCYVHPAVVEAYLEDTLSDALQLTRPAGPVSGFPRLSAAEAAVLRLLEARAT